MDTAVPMPAPAAASAAAPWSRSAACVTSTARAAAKGHIVLEDVDLSLRSNEIVALLGPLRLRQVHAAAHHRRAAAADLRNGQDRRRRRRRPGQPGRHGVPELCAVSLADRAGERRDRAGSPARRSGGTPQARARRHRSHRPRRLRDRLSQGALGRHAAAGRARPRAGGASAGPVDGRAVLGARRAHRRDAAHRPARPLVRRPHADLVHPHGHAQYRGSGPDVRPHPDLLLQPGTRSWARSRSTCRSRAAASIPGSASWSTTSMRA